MSENTLEYYVAPGLFPEKRIGDTIDMVDIKAWAKAAFGSCAIRSGGGFHCEGFYNNYSVAKRQWFPSVGLTNYMQYTGGLGAIKYNGTTYNITSTNMSCGYYRNSSLTGKQYGRAPGCDYRTNVGSRFSWTTPNRTIDEQSVYSEGDPEAFGTGGLHVIDVTPMTSMTPGALTPELIMCIDESADNARFTPQMLLSIPYTQSASNWRCIDPRLDIKRMLDKFSATAYLEKEALINGDYYVYVVYDAIDGLTNDPENTLDVYADGVQLDMYRLRNTNYNRIAVGKIRTASSYMLSENDYIRVTISTRTNSNYLVTNNDTFAPWEDWDVVHSIGNRYKQAVAIFIAGKTSRFGNGDNVPSPSTNVWW